jgi:hypothetical protein
MLPAWCTLPHHAAARAPRPAPSQPRATTAPRCWRHHVTVRRRPRASPHRNAASAAAAQAMRTRACSRREPSAACRTLALAPRLQAESHSPLPASPSALPPVPLVAPAGPAAGRDAGTRGGPRRAGEDGTAGRRQLAVKIQEGRRGTARAQRRGGGWARARRGQARRRNGGGVQCNLHTSLSHVAYARGSTQARLSFVRHIAERAGAGACLRVAAWPARLGAIPSVPAGPGGHGRGRTRPGGPGARSARGWRA